MLGDIVGASRHGRHRSQAATTARPWPGRLRLRVFSSFFTSEPKLRVQNVDGCAVFGRFAIVRHVPAQRAAAFAAAQSAAETTTVRILASEESG